MIVIIIITVIFALSVWACCKISGDCAREEEKEDGE